MADSAKPPVNDAFKLTLTDEEQSLQFGTQHSWRDMNLDLYAVHPNDPKKH